MIVLILTAMSIFSKILCCKKYLKSSEMNCKYKTSNSCKRLNGKMISGAPNHISNKVSVAAGTSL